MPGPQDDDLQRLQEDAAQLAVDSGADPADLARQLAGAHTAEMGASMADRYAGMGARWLADPVATRLDEGLIRRLEKQGFRRERLADVRIHHGPKAQAAADALGARAFAVGEKDVFFGRGEFDPSSRTGRAVLAHEIAHIAPPTPGAGAATGAGGMPASFGAPVLNERKRGDEDAAGEEQHERVAREAEARVYAQDDEGDAPVMAAAPAAAAAAAAPQQAEIDPVVLENKVMAILAKMERTEIERGGAF